MVELARSIALGLGGVATGLALAELRLYLGRYRRKNPDEPLPFGRLRAIILIRAAMLCAFGYMAAELIQRLGKDTLTWRTPVAALAYAIAVCGLVLILREDERMQDTPRRRKSDQPS